MLAVKGQEREDLLVRLSENLGCDARHKRSWLGYLGSMDFFVGDDATVYAIRKPQVIKTIYIGHGERMPKTEMEAKQAWIEKNLEQAEKTLPINDAAVIVPFMGKGGEVLFYEPRRRPRHHGEPLQTIPENVLKDLIKASAEIYKRFAAKLSRAWERHGTLVALPA